MVDLPTPSQITELASLLAPGLIISTIRIRAITGSVPDFKDRLVAYGLISTGYFAAITPFFHVNDGVSLPRWSWGLLQYFVVPCIIGAALAYIHQWKLSYWLAEKVRLHLAHHLPASWDYAFESRSDATFLIVTLKDGTQVAGRWARRSFASSTKDERDILIYEVWDTSNPDQPWTPLIPPRSILICSEEIRYIEFFEEQNGGG